MRKTYKKKSQKATIKETNEFANNTQYHKGKGLRALEKAKEVEAHQLSEGKKWVKLENGAMVLR